jgi:hypothetical protein
VTRGANESSGSMPGTSSSDPNSDSASACDVPPSASSRDRRGHRRRPRAVSPPRPPSLPLASTGWTRPRPGCRRRTHPRAGAPLGVPRRRAVCRSVPVERPPRSAASGRGGPGTPSPTTSPRGLGSVDRSESRLRLLLGFGHVAPSERVRYRSRSHQPRRAVAASPIADLHRTTTRRTAPTAHHAVGVDHPSVRSGR